ncbi:hypothetical protein CkaCkLH20_05472 [Colletotrichum karsti]|uniref:NACHT-NTPase and P-loop NTPases N-terminal domain-containing protein n=1 Tax=Colletotrichum karsti TaxID=1095194 RepID=A0A9P6IAY0_9PEZI|nr:uncharacterized protein CkaCkLH20_05472 [Colletotrichum karsti]KAF9877206.1 hypothetical protein CkaCkLH20_05472 [Colletotrichum karsti]
MNAYFLQEALGAVAACVDILARALGILERARTAWVRQKNGIAYLDNVHKDVEATITLLKLVGAERELHQEHVNHAVNLVMAKARQLFDVIRDLGEKSDIGGGFKKFVGHFLDGCSEQIKLDAMRKELNESKATLILALQMAQVGLIRSMGRGDIIVNIEIVNQIDQRVQMCPGLEQGLRLAQLLQQRAWKDEKGKWHLNDQDLVELQKPPPYEYKPAPLALGQTRGVVQSNEVVGATFVGMGVGRDGGNEFSVNQPDELIVMNNKASQGGLFLGGGISASNLVYLFQHGVINSMPTTQQK